MCGLKKIIRMEADIYRCNRFKKGCREMVTIASSLYRTDDDLFIMDIKSNDAYVIYRINGTQPYLPIPRYVDTDNTRKKIVSAKIGGNKRSTWMRLDKNSFMTILTMVAIVGGIAWGFISFGGIKL